MTKYIYTIQYCKYEIKFVYTYITNKRYADIINVTKFQNLAKYISDEILFANNILKYNFFILSNLWNFRTEINYSRLSELEMTIVIMNTFPNEYLYNYYNNCTGSVGRIVYNSYMYVQRNLEQFYLLHIPIFNYVHNNITLIAIVIRMYVYYRYLLQKVK